MSKGPNAIALLPCPFCGKAADWNQTHLGKTFIYCPDYGEPTECPAPGTGWLDSAKDAARSWNMRKAQT